MTRRDKIKHLVAILFTKYNKDLSLITEPLLEIWETCLHQVGDKGLERAMRHRFGKFMPSVDEVEIVGLELDDFMLAERIANAFNLEAQGKLETLNNKYFYRAFLRKKNFLSNEKDSKKQCDVLRETIFKMMERGCAEIPAALIPQDAGEPISKEKAAENLRKLKETWPHVFGRMS